MKILLACLCASVSLYWSCGSAAGQAPELGGLVPAGGPRGQMTIVRIAGKNMTGARLHLNGRGVDVKKVEVAPAGNAVTVEIVVDSGAPLGPREVRITTSKGVSNGARFWVDLHPNSAIEPPSKEDQAPALLSGKAEVINGRIATKAGRDRFAIEAAAGDTWSFDCYADRIRSRMDPVLEIRDSRNVLLKLAQSTWENDPRFAHTFAKAGKYTLIVRDSEYNGGPNYMYRLLASRSPLAISTSPLGVRSGTAGNLAVQCAPGSGASAQVSVPAGTALGTDSIYWAEAALPGGTVVIPVLAGPEPVTCAAEGDAVQPLPALPAAVDGVFARTARARFRFHAAAGEKILFDVYGRRIGSRIDAQIRVLDEAGKVVGENDDLSVLTKDARLEFAAPAAGDYVAEVRNVEEVVGPDCGYRIKVSKVVPDFRISIAADRLAPPAGGTIALPVTVERIAGFSGPVEVRVEGLPQGVACSGGVIAAGKDSVEMTLTSSLESPPAAGTVRVVGTAEIGGKPAVREAPGWEQYEHRSIDLLLSVEYSYTRPHHLWDMLLCAVSDRVDPVTIFIPQAAYALNRGDKVEIPVRIIRHAGAASEVKLEVRNLPGKVTVQPVVIAAGQTEGKLILIAGPDAPVDYSNVIVTAKHGGSTSLAPAIRLSVTAPR